MKEVTMTGIVIKQQVISEKDKLLTILTKENGIVYAFAGGAKMMRSRLFSASQLFAYCRFIVYKGRDKYIINSAEIISTFRGLENSLVSLAAAQYFADIARNTVPRDVEAEEMLRLFLNSLYFIVTGKRDIMLIKAVFELRAMTIAGFMPDFAECPVCGKIMDNEAFFDLKSGICVCGNCRAEGVRYETLPELFIQTMEYICTCDMEKLFSFTLSKSACNMLSLITEKYVEMQIGKRLKTLDFLKNVAEMQDDCSKEIGD